MTRIKYETIYFFREREFIKISTGGWQINHNFYDAIVVGSKRGQ